MRTASKIRKAFKGTKYEGCHIFKGWHTGRQQEGWIARPFQGQEIFLGKTDRDAVSYAQTLVDYEKEQS